MPSDIGRASSVPHDPGWVLSLTDPAGQEGGVIGASILTIFVRIAVAP
jgi:hypothetical protein